MKDSYQIRVRVDREIYVALTEEASEHGEDFNTLVRRVLRDHIKVRKIGKSPLRDLFFLLRLWREKRRELQEASNLDSWNKDTANADYLGLLKEQHSRRILDLSDWVEKYLDVYLE